MNNCLSCNKQTMNPKFCSRSCSSSYNGKLKPKRKLTRTCADCDTKVNYRNKYCKSCHDIRFKAKDMTIGESMYKHHKSAAYALIRSRAVSNMKPKGKPCSNCGYTNHVEVCHIKAISSYDKSTLISVVNNKSNLVLLCPNCHWEFDNGLLKMVGATGFEPMKPD